MAIRKRVERGIYRTENSDGSVSWMIDYLNPDKKRIRKTFTTKTQAEAELTKRKNLINEGEYASVIAKSASEVGVSKEKPFFLEWRNRLGLPGMATRNPSSESTMACFFYIGHPLCL